MRPGFATEYLSSKAWLARGTVSFRLPEFAEIIQNQLKVEVTIFRFSRQSVTQTLASIRAQLVDRLAAHREQLQRSTGSSRPAQGQDILQIRPGLYGISVDLRALWRRLQSKG